VFERCLIIGILAIGTGVIIYATLGRLLSIHRPLGWAGGGHVTLFGELCIGVFVLSCGMAALQENAAWAIPMLAAFVGAVLSQQGAHRRHVAAENQLRFTNAAKYPGVFDKPPPLDPDATNDEVFDLFDAGACTYLGQLTRLDLKTLIARHSDIPEQGPNDIFMLRESLVLFPAGELSDDLIALLNKAFEERDYLELRWMPPSIR
jgi:hypothetical protein